MNRTLTLGLVQHACGEDPAENFERCREGVREATRLGARLVLTQELFRTRYFCQQEDPIIGDRGAQVGFRLLGAVVDVVGEHTAGRAAGEEGDLDIFAPLASAIGSWGSRCPACGSGRSAAGLHSSAGL